MQGAILGLQTFEKSPDFPLLTYEQEIQLADQLAPQVPPAQQGLYLPFSQKWLDNLFAGRRGNAPDQYYRQLDTQKQRYLQALATNAMTKDTVALESATYSYMRYAAASDPGFAVPFEKALQAKQGSGPPDWRDSASLKASITLLLPGWSLSVKPSIINPSVFLQSAIETRQKEIDDIVAKFKIHDVNFINANFQPKGATKRINLVPKPSRTTDALLDYAAETAGQALDKAPINDYALNTPAKEQVARVIWTNGHVLQGLGLSDFRPSASGYPAAGLPADHPGPYKEMPGMGSYPPRPEERPDPHPFKDDPVAEQLGMDLTEALVSMIP